MGGRVIIDRLAADDDDDDALDRWRVGLREGDGCRGGEEPEGELGDL